jgi:hypothetical protein
MESFNGAAPVPSIRVPPIRTRGQVSKDILDTVDDERGYLNLS